MYNNYRYYILYYIHVIMLSLSVCVCVSIDYILSIVYIDVCVNLYTLHIRILKSLHLNVMTCVYVCVILMYTYVCWQRHEAPALYCTSPCTSLEQYCKG